MPPLRHGASNIKVDIRLDIEATSAGRGGS